MSAIGMTGCQKMIDPHEYSVSVQHLKDGCDDTYCATVKELPDISAYEPTAERAYAAAIALIRDAQNLFEAKGRVFPAPLGHGRTR